MSRVFNDVGRDNSRRVDDSRNLLLSSHDTIDGACRGEG